MIPYKSYFSVLDAAEALFLERSYSGQRDFNLFLVLSSSF